MMREGKITPVMILKNEIKEEESKQTIDPNSMNRDIDYLKTKSVLVLPDLINSGANTNKRHIKSISLITPLISPKTTKNKILKPINLNGTST